LKEIDTKQRTHFFNHLTKKKYSMVSKCLALDASLSKLPKNMFGCPLKLILGFLSFLEFFAMNKTIHTQLSMNVKTHHYHMN
jgi:hypothetical protein